MIRPILQIGDPLLREVARKVSREELATPKMQAFIDDLIETMRHANGAGLAATQVGEMVQICAVEVRDNPRYPYKPNIPLTVLVNAELEPASAERFDNYEGCLSVPNLRGIVSRNVTLKVRALDRHGNPIEDTVHGLKACTYQHEIDHLHGKLFVDRVTDTKTLCTWAEFERHHLPGFADRVRALVGRLGS